MKKPITTIILALSVSLPACQPKLNPHGYEWFMNQACPQSYMHHVHLVGPQPELMDYEACLDEMHRTIREVSQLAYASCMPKPQASPAVTSPRQPAQQPQFQRGNQ